MKKEWLIAILVILLLLIGIIAGIYVYKINNLQNYNMLQDKKLAEANNNNTANLTQITSFSEERISPDCNLIKKQYYKSCDHILRDEQRIDTKLINYTKEQFLNEYKDWNVEEFNNNEIIIYKENDGYCDQHYTLKENSGVIGIYQINEDGKQVFKENTEIQTMYLPEEDIQRLTARNRSFRRR